jgi:DNA polymerase-3 subunit gamma/tau
MLRTFDELNYRQEPRLHLELGLMKLVHLQRLIPLEQILSGLPGAARPPAALGAGKGAGSPRPVITAPPTPVQTPPRPLPVEPAKPPAPSPFELDRLRKLGDDAQEVVRTPPAPPVVVPEVKAVVVVPEVTAPETRVEPEPRPAKTGGIDLDGLRDVVTAALNEQGHNTAASLLGAGRWRLDEDGAIQVEVGVKKTMLGLTMNGEAWKIVREALRGAGATQKMTVVPGEAADPTSPSARVWSRDSIEAVALGNPLVRQAQELFHAEVRSVLDLRDNQGNDSRSKG